MTPSAAMQRYAAEIFRIEQDHEFASLTDLADHMDVSLQAASRMIRRLKDEELIVHEPYRGVRLTPSGRAIALPAVRRHRLSEVYLVSVMGFDWSDVHSLVDDFELGINQTIEDRMDEILGHPTRCPHGEPIPSKDGVLPVMDDIRLIELAQGTAARVSRIRTHNSEKLRYFGKLGIRPGADIHFLTCAPFEGPVRLRVGPIDQVIGYNLASALWVIPLAE